MQKDDLMARIKCKLKHNNSVKLYKPERAQEAKEKGLVRVLEPERLRKALEALEDGHTFQYETADLDSDETEKRTFGDEEDEEDPEEETPRQCGADTADGDPCKNEIDEDEDTCWLHADDED